AAAGRPLFIEETRRLLLASAEEPPDQADAADRLRLGSGYLNITAAVEAARRSGPSLAAPVQRTATGVTPIVKEAVPDPDRLDANRNEAMADISEDFQTEQAESHDTASEWIPAPQVTGAVESGEATRDRQYTRNDDRYDRFRPLPFQFQIPIGG